MRHTLLAALTLALAPIGFDGFRPWPSDPPSVSAVQPKPSTLSEAYGPGRWVPCPSQTLEWFDPAPIGAGSTPCPGDSVILGPGPPYRLEPFGAGYLILPGGVALVGSGSTWDNALGQEPSK